MYQIRVKAVFFIIISSYLVNLVIAQTSGRIVSKNCLSIVDPQAAKKALDINLESASFGLSLASDKSRLIMLPEGFKAKITPSGVVVLPENISYIVESGSNGFTRINLSGLSSLKLGENYKIDKLSAKNSTSGKIVSKYLISPKETFNNSGVTEFAQNIILSDLKGKKPFSAQIDDKIEKLNISLLKLNPQVLNDCGKLGYSIPIKPKFSFGIWKNNPYAAETPGDIDVVLDNFNHLASENPQLGIKKFFKRSILEISEEQRRSEPNNLCFGHFIVVEPSSDNQNPVILSADAILRNGMLDDTSSFNATPNSTYNVGSLNYVLNNSIDSSSNVLKAIKAEKNDKKAGKDVVVAILDTGFYHENKFWTMAIPTSDARDFTSIFGAFNSNLVPRDTSGISDFFDLRKVKNGSDPFHLTDGLSTTDVMGHGTAVAALAASVAPGVKILPLKVCDLTGECAGMQIAQGICYALQKFGPTRNYPDRKLVINLSLGTKEVDVNLRKFIEYALRIGVPVAISAGNHEYDMNTKTFKKEYNDIRFPAAFGDKSMGEKYLDGLLVTSGVLIDNMNKPVAWEGFIQNTTYVDLYAPAGAFINNNITGLTAPNPKGDNASRYLGTSFASPFAAGALAIWKSACPKLSVQQIEQRLKALALRNSGILDAHIPQDKECM
jgi:hypothetical protein